MPIVRWIVTVFFLLSSYSFAGSLNSIWPEEIYPSKNGIKKVIIGDLVEVQWPWVYDYAKERWIWLDPQSTPENIRYYSTAENSWYGSAEGMYGWSFNFTSAEWVDAFGNSYSFDPYVFIYRQGFANDTGTAQLSAEYGWRWFHRNNAEEGTFLFNRIVHFAGGAPVGNIAALIPHGSQIAAGNWTANTTQVQLAFTELELSENQAAMARLRMEINHSEQPFPARFAIRTSGGWFVSHPPFLDTTPGWHECELVVGDENISWLPLDFQPATTLALTGEDGISFSAMDDEINAIGFFVEPTAIHRMDNFSISLPLSLAGSGFEPKGPAPQEMFDVFLLIGQSNMAGRGVVEELDTTIDEKVWMFNAVDEWAPAQEPMHFDNPGLRGVGPGFAFGRKMADATDGRTIGLIPNAVGGTIITYWSPDHTRGYYADALRRARLAQRDGLLRGILWQQGESDSTESRAPLYEQRLRDLIANFRRDLNAPALPFVLGGLPPFLLSEHAATVEQAIIAVAESTSNVEYVAGSQLGHIGDDLHYNAAAQRENGEAYAAAMLYLLDIAGEANHQ